MQVWHCIQQYQLLVMIKVITIFTEYLLCGHLQTMHSLSNLNLSKTLGGTYYQYPHLTDTEEHEMLSNFIATPVTKDLKLKPDSKVIPLHTLV